MNIGLVDLKDPSHLVVDKTIAGGMGTATRYGSGPFENLLTRLKAQAIRLLPYNVAYTAAILRAQGHRLTYHTSAHTPSYDLAVVFTSIPSHQVDVAFLEILRSKGVPSVVTGTLAQVIPDSYGDGNVVLKGEAEAYFNGTWSLEKIRSQMGALEDVGQVPDLNALPFPDFSIFDGAQSRYAIVSTLGQVLPVVASRGCPYPCGYYCPYPLGDGKAMRFRDPQSVVLELKRNIDTYGIRAFKFRDPIFTVNRRRTEALLEAMIDADLGVTWGCETHLSVMDEPLLEKMAQAGCVLIQTGIESTQGAVIKASQRKSAEELHQEAMIEACHRLGIKTAIYFIVGLPEDTPDGMRQSLSYAQNLPGTFVQITICTPYPGTRFYEDVKDKLTTDDWSNLDQYTPVLATEGYGPQELMSIMSEGYRGFYLRPRWVRTVTEVVLNGQRQRFAQGRQ